MQAVPTALGRWLYRHQIAANAGQTPHILQ